MRNVTLSWGYVAARTDDPFAAARLVEVLVAQGARSATDGARLSELLARTDDPFAAARLAQVLVAQGAFSAIHGARLSELLARTDDPFAAARLAQVLVAQGALSATDSARLSELAGDGNDTPTVRYGLSRVRDYCRGSSNRTATSLLRSSGQADNVDIEYDRQAA